MRGAAGLRKKLAEGKESALLSRRLVELERRAPCPRDMQDLRFQGASGPELDEFAEQWGPGPRGPAGAAPLGTADAPARSYFCS